VKIGLVCPYDLGRHGGVQDQVVRLAGWLRGRGHETVLVGAGEDGEDSPDGSVRLGRATVLPGNRSAVPIMIDPRVGSRLQHALAGCDVVHVHEPFMPTIGPAALRLAGVPLIATFHADAPRWARRGYSLGRHGARALLGRVAITTAVSRVAASALDPIVPVRIVPNGIDVGDYTPRRAKTPGRAVFVGRDDPRKGLDVLLRAWPEIRNTMPDATLRIIGAERDDPPRGVAFLGRLSEADKRMELSAAEVLIAPNTGGESFGIVVLEGMAAGCVVVASALPAFTSVLGSTGVLTAVGDESGIARAVSALFADDQGRVALQDEAQLRAGRFDGSVVTDTYLDIYEEAVAL